MGIFLLSSFFLVFFDNPGLAIYSYSLDYYSNFLTLDNILIFSGITLLLIFLPSLSQRINSAYLQLPVLLLFLPLVVLFAKTSNMVTFFLCYELFILPSVIIVMFGSPNRRGFFASIYFLLWTQVGSFLVFCAILLMFNESKSFNFSLVVDKNNLISLLVFLGFGIKIPVWPFHYWLTKTHVEAPTYFSIYLSGFLVKTALYGMFVFLGCVKLSPLFNLFLVVSLYGVIDSSLKMWVQVDLKKLIAYGTIQEMNLILISFLVGTATSVKAGSLFIIAHTLLSTIFFLLVDSVYRRFNSRTTYNIKGLINSHGYFGYIIFIACLLFAGLPFTLKFVVEVYVFNLVLSLNYSLFFITAFFCNWIGLVSFTKHWFGTLFGVNSASISSDVSYRELLMYICLAVLLVLVGFVSVFLI